jgi:tRNA pseudouridine38-40 synthase
VGKLGPDADPITVAALVAYDGTEYMGFQVQPGVPTIQGALEQALGTFTTLHGRIAGAGRTDTGVHARGQVIAASVGWRHDLAALQRAWNAHLPAAISIEAVQAAPEGFHPRFSARSRTYRYTVVMWAGLGQPPLRAPLEERFAHFEPRRLNVAAMGEAAALLVGRQDFATFGQPPQGESTVRSIFVARWLQEATGRLIFEIRADAFLKHMVRRVVGSLLEVGRERWSVAEFAAALHACDTGRSAPPAAPNGLVLETVEYAPEWGLTFTTETNRSTH